MWALILKQMLSLQMISHSEKRNDENDFCFRGIPFNDNSINFHGSVYKVPYKTLFKVPYKTYSLTDNLVWGEVSKQCVMSKAGKRLVCIFLGVLAKGLQGTCVFLYPGWCCRSQPRIKKKSKRGRQEKKWPLDGREESRHNSPPKEMEQTSEIGQFQPEPLLRFPFRP